MSRPRERGARASMDAARAQQIVRSYEQQDRIRKAIAERGGALKPIERAFLFALTTHVDHDGEATPGDELMASYISRSTRQMRTIRSGLVKAGWLLHELHQVGSGWKRSAYCFPITLPLRRFIAEVAPHENAPMNGAEPIAEVSGAHGGSLGSAQRKSQERMAEVVPLDRAHEQVQLPTGTVEPQRAAAPAGEPPPRAEEGEEDANQVSEEEEAARTLAELPPAAQERARRLMDPPAEPLVTEDEKSAWRDLGFTEEEIERTSRRVARQRAAGAA